MELTAEQLLLKAELSQEIELWIDHDQAYCDFLLYYGQQMNLITSQELDICREDLNAYWKIRGQENYYPEALPKKFAALLCK